MYSRIFLIFFSLVSFASILAQSKFEIIYVADYRWNPQHPTWLAEIAGDWHATGICLQVFWGDIEKIENQYDWEKFDNVIDIITSRKYNKKDLDIYIRICMGIEKPSWISPGKNYFTEDDFQIKYDGSLYNHFDYETGPIYKTWQYPLNFTSPRSVGKMKKFLDSVLSHINWRWPSKKARIKEIIPTFSANDEQEYPNAIMCGYSLYEKTSFQNYLRNKYFTISNLNKKWNTKFNFFSDIDPQKYNWWDIAPYTYYDCANGRVDWIYYRTSQLSSFINSLADICSVNNFKIGAQIGSLYDSVIENRGWVDPTILFEKVDAIHTADIYQYSKNFDFAANYAKSLSGFWSSINRKDIKFSTETNWPGFNGQSDFFLSQKWKDQLEVYFNMGANALFLVGWDKWIDKLDSLQNSYSNWLNTLSYYKKLFPIISQNQYALHLGCEKIFFNNHNHMSNSGKFAIYDSIFVELPTSLVSGYNRDVITNYMIEKNPAYLNRYNKIYFTKTSLYITEKAYNNLILDEITTPYENITIYSNADRDGVFTQSFKNEYGEIRSLAKLISRSQKILNK